MNNTVPPGYKQTEVGVIPVDWEIKRLGEVATIATGNTPPTKDISNYGDEFFFVGPVDMGDTKFISKTEKMLSKKGFAMSRRFPKDSILFVSIGSTIGKCGIAPVELTSNQQINAIFPSTNFSSDYLFYAISSAAERIRSQAGEQAVPIVNKTQFSKTTVAFPPLLEQRAIAEALSDVDGLLAGLDRLITKKRDLKQAAMQQLLTGQTRLPGFHGEWEVKRLGELGSTYGGLTGKTKSDFDEGAAQYITFMNVMSNVVIDCGILEQVQVLPTESQNRALKDDLFFNGSSETPEEVAMCSVLLDEVRDVYLNSFCFGFRFHGGAKANGLFMAYYLRSREGRELMKSLAQGSTRYNLSKVALLESPLRLPPAAEQTAIAEVLTDMDAELAALEGRRDKTRALKQAMMQELLTGRTRLVKP
jgi:type I restriction enzyme S subunit